MARFRLLTIPADGDSEWLPLSPVSAETIARSVVEGRSEPTVLIRHQLPYILLGPKDLRLPDLNGGVAFLQEQGLAAYDRIGGGSAVLLDHTCVSFAVARPCRDLGMIDRNYDELTRGVRLALQRLGLKPTFGAAVGSYCEGPNDLLVDGLKIAGVAQAIRGGYTLVSGMLLVDQDPVSTTTLLNHFYAAARGSPTLNPNVVTSLAHLLGRPISTQEVAEQLVAGFAESFDLTPDRFTAEERAVAESLMPLRRRIPEPT